MLFALLTLAACNDYNFDKENDVWGGDSGTTAPDRPSDADDTGGDDTGPGDTSPDPDDPGTPPDSLPPEVIEGECEGTNAVSISPTIYVTTSAPTAATTLTASEAGWYHLYDYTIAESGESQRNETAYIQVSNSTNPDGHPALANCGDDWIVEDADNDGGLPTGSRIYLGTFWLDAGDNTLSLMHFCPLYEAGSCSSFHDTDDSSSTCESGNVNSVHLEGEGLCVTEA